MERNKSKKRVSSKIMAGMLAMLLCFATSLTALAGTGGTQAAPEKAEFTKILQYANVGGLSTPNVTFNFTFTAVQKDGVTANATSMPAITPAGISFNGETGTLNSGTGMLEVTKTSGDVLASLNWATLGTGVYEYEVKESATAYTVTGEAINDSQAEYTLYVVVSYDSISGSYFVEETYTDQTVDNSGTTNSGKSLGGANTADGDYNFKFMNTYTKLGGATPGTDALTITKTTTGTGSDQSKQFTYTLTADDSVTGVAPATYTGTITRADATTSTVSLTADGTALTFTLADGEEIVFNDLPVGTTFEVEETGAASYIATYTGTTAAGSISSGTGTAGANLTTGTQTIDTANNEVDFTNTYDSSLIPTGVLSNIAPFLALIVVAVVGFVAFAATNRRKFSR